MVLVGGIACFQGDLTPAPHTTSDNLLSEEEKDASRTSLVSS